MEPFAYTCPFCGRDATITDENHWTFFDRMEHETASGLQAVGGSITICPNPKCKRFSLNVYNYDAEQLATGFRVKGQPRVWRLIPPSKAKVFPDYIPKQIRDDYEQACLILELSPKASASQSRRCLQGMIRDFWGIRRDRLIDEIEAIKDKVDPQTWQAIDAVRSIGNIGAHMEKDVNLIIDVDPEEADFLVWLIETLLRDWYITKRLREENLKTIAEIAESKKKARAVPAVDGGGTGSASTTT